jgi:hypothetical protein
VGASWRVIGGNMSPEETKESQVVTDTKAFNGWFEADIEKIIVKAKEIGLDVKLKEIMRMAWRRCCEHKNKEIAEHLEYIKALKHDIDLKQQKYDELHLELQKVTNKLISAEKNAKKN